MYVCMYLCIYIYIYMYLCIYVYMSCFPKEHLIHKQYTITHNYNICESDVYNMCMWYMYVCVYIYIYINDILQKTYHDIRMDTKPQKLLNPYALARRFFFALATSTVRSRPPTRCFAPSAAIKSWMGWISMDFLEYKSFWKT